MSENKKDARKADLYLCECGPIIKDAVDLDTLQKEAEASADYDRVIRYPTLCSPEGKIFLQEKIAEAPDNLPVIAACTPREHEKTFKAASVAAGANPYLISIAAIREQAAWVHKDRGEATEKSRILIRAARARALEQAPLEGRTIEVNTDAVVIGTGVAGMTSAKMLADAGRRVYLLEKEPAIGGTVARLSELYPALECASCILEPLMDDVLHHENITLLTQSEVDEVMGYFGRFVVRVKKEARHVDPEACYGCRACQEVCPVELPNSFEADLSKRKAVFIPYKGALPNVSVVDEESCLHFKDDSCDACVSACAFGAIDLSTRSDVVELNVGAIVIATGADLQTRAGDDSAYSDPNVFTTLELERMLNSSGCTEGEIRLRDGRVPRSIGLVHCADERGHAPTEACSRICCMSMVKYARLIREKFPDIRIVMLTFERSFSGKGYRELARSVMQEAHVEEIKLRSIDEVCVLCTDRHDESVEHHLDPTGQVAAPQDGVRLQALRPDLPTIETHVDMVVMAPPVVGAAGFEAAAKSMRVDLDDAGFVLPEHPRLRSFSSRVEGIYIAGAAQGPKDVEEASSHGAAAAGTVLASLVPGRQLEIDPQKALVHDDICGGCQICPSLCPYKAITFNAEQKVAEVNEILCHGCGVCVSACPSSAIEARHFNENQLMAEISALIE
ncbi:CoB--CoM heterodisulfide reductase iron-sulfur subunit A family protein [Myxococcota bacterium]|nr:CoB--CoM heterodisulfide reductase iron-sulfur subunit A family protein [Myxococcota bacterium]